MEFRYGCVVQPLMSTNPQAVVAPNGSILLFHIGKELPEGCVKNCSKDATERGPLNCPETPHGASVAVANHPDIVNIMDVECFRAQNQTLIGLVLEHFQT